MMKKLFILLLLPLLLLSACDKPTGGTEPTMTVVFADVGKADFILIKSDGKFGVIDAGYKSSKDKIDSVMEKYGVESIEFAVATHNDKDHIGSMSHVIEKYGVKTLYICPLESEEKMYKNMLESAAIKGTAVVKTRQGMKFSLGNASFTVLEPDDGLVALGTENDSSIVLRMEYGSKSVLFMGDAQIKTETAMMKKYSADLSCDVIKIGHHGSSKASSQLFLSKTGAKYAVITTGSEESAADVTLKAIDACKMKLYNTETDGDVIMLTDGQAVTFQKEK